eukprot:4546165-Alexandrium_andersonii.AAC.1
MANPTLDLGPCHQVLDALLVPGVGAHGVLTQEVRTPPQLGDVGLRDELQVGPGVAHPLNDLRRVHPWVVDIGVQPAP